MNSASPKSIYLVDRSIAELSGFLLSIPQDAEVCVIDPAQDGVAQVIAALGDRGGFEAIHIVSHGAAGAIELGSTLVTLQELSERKAEFAQIGQALSEDGDILLYGCDVGQHDAGHAFVSLFAEITGADVAASDDLTGSGELGGNWVLERHVGDIEAKALQAEEVEVLLPLSFGDTRVDIEAGPGDAYASSAPTLMGDKLHLTWMDSASGITYESLIDPNGTLSTLVPITLDPATNNGSDTVVYEQLSDGNLLVTWYSGSSGTGLTDTYFKILDAAGAEVLGATKINSEAGELNRFTDVAELSNGNLAFVWATSGGNYALRRFEKDGTAVDAAQLSVTQMAGISGSQYDHQIVANDNGKFMIAWDAYNYDTYLGLFFEDAASAPMQVGGSPLVALSDTQFGRDKTAHLGVLPDGRFVMTFMGQANSGTSSRDARFRIFNEDGTAATAEDTILGTFHSWGSVSAPLITDSGFMISYTFNDLVAPVSYLFEYDLAGNFVGDISSMAPSVSGEWGTVTPFLDVDGNISWMVNDDLDGDEIYDLWLLRQDTVVVAGDAPGIPAVPLLDPSSDSGLSGEDGLTNDATPLLQGTADANAVVTLFSSIDGLLGEAIADETGKWTFVPGALSEGAHSVTATATANGMTSAASPALSLVIDVTAPAQPSAPDLNADSDTGSSAIDNVTSDTTPAFSSVAEANSVVTLYSSIAGAVGTTTVDGAGLWSLTPALALVQGTHEFTVVATDAAGNSSAASQSVSVAIEFNDVPTATNLSQTLAFVEGASSIPLDAIVVTDPDSGDTITATLTLSNTAAGTLTTGSFGSGTSNYSADTGVWTMIGSAADVNAALAAVVFIPAPNWDQAFTIASRIRDAAGTGPADGTITLQATPVNDAPTASNLTQVVTLTEDSGVDISFTDIVVSDVDSGDTITATLALSNPAAGALSTGTFGSATATYDAGTGIWTVTGSVADVNAALAAVTLAPASNWDQSFTIVSRIRDAANVGPEDGVITVTVTAVGDAPTATNGFQTRSFIEDGGAVALDDIVVTDVDSGETVRATLTLSNTAAGSLSTGTYGVASSTFNADSGLWAVTGSVADVNAALAAVAFTPAQNWNQDFTITTRIRDAANTGPADGTITMQATAVNDAPTATNLTQSKSFVEDGGVITLDPIVVSDVDSGDLVAVTLIMSNAAAGSLSIGTFGAVTSTFNPENGVWNVSGSVADVNAALAAVAFTPAASWSEGITIYTYVSDIAGSGPAMGAVTLTAVPVNDAPAGADNTLRISEDASHTFTAADFGFADSDGNALAEVRITSLPAVGTLTNDGVAINAGDEVSQADIDAGHLRFTPATHDSGDGYASFTFQVRDDGGTVTGGVDLDASPNTISIDVQPVNDAPSANPLDGYLNTGAMTQTDGLVTITGAMLHEGDVDDDGAGVAFTITQATSAGTLFIDSNGNGAIDLGEALITGAVFTQENVDAGQIKYQHGGGTGGYDRFSFAVADGGEDGAAALTGQDFVFAIAERPVISFGDDSPAHQEDGPATAVMPGLTITDGDSATMTSATVAITDLVAGDRLSFTDQNGIVGSFNAETGILLLSGIATAAQYEAALRSVTYSTASNNPATGPGSDDRLIRVSVNDGSMTSATQDVTLTVTNSNDAPTLIATAASDVHHRVGSATGVQLFTNVTLSTVELDQLVAALNLQVEGVRSEAGANLVIGGGSLSLVPGSSIALGETGSASVADLGDGVLGVTISFGAGISSTAAQALIESIHYHNTAASPALGAVGSFAIVSITDTGSTNATSLITGVRATATVLPALIDGAPVTVDVITRPDGSIGQSVTIPAVTPSRVEETGDSNVADIPLVTAEGVPLLLAQLPAGYGLQASGMSQPQSSGSSLADLIREIEAHSIAGSSDQQELVGAGSGFLQTLSADAPLLVQTIVPTLVADAAPTGPLVISAAAAAPGASVVALVIDASGLPAGTPIQLENVAFAVIVGSVTVTGGSGSQIVRGDSAAQSIVLGEDDDVLYGGGGDDTVGSEGGNDRLFGNAGDDTLFGGAGNDLLHGGQDGDVARYSGDMARYEITRDHGQTIVRSLDRPDDTDTLVNIETLQFDDATYAVENDDFHIWIASLYQQVLDRQADLGGFQHWSGKHADGMTIGTVAIEFLKSAEYADGSGSAFDALSQAVQVELLYGHFLGRASDAEGHAYWVDRLAEGHGIEEVAGLFVQSIEMQGAYIQEAGWEFIL